VKAHPNSGRRKIQADLIKSQKRFRGVAIHQKRVQETIRRSEEMFRRTFEAIPDPAYLWVRQDDGRIVLHRANLAASRITRNQIQKYLGIQLENLYANQPELIARIRQVLQTGKSVSEEMLYTYTSIRGKKWLLVDYVQAAENSILVITKDISQRKRNEEKLLRYQDQLRSLTLDLTLTEERERRNIAVQLHDHIGQQLALAKMKLEALRCGEILPAQALKLKEIRRILDETIQGTRSLIFELSPPILYELGFEAAVEWLAESIHDRFHLPVVVQIDGKGEPLNDKMQIMLFQIVRELLLNVAKHSRARKGRIEVRRGRHDIQIRVEDNGIGFDAGEYFARKNAAGFGFFSIRERLSHLGGDLKVESEAGKGTSVRLKIPLRRVDKTQSEKNNGNSNHHRR
jgi:signal transduction histidine kinase